MSSYNDQEYYAHNGAYPYVQNHMYPRPGVQVQIPRIHSQNPVQINPQSANHNGQSIPVQYGYNNQLSSTNSFSQTPNPTAVNGYTLQEMNSVPRRAAESSVDYQLVLLALAEEYFEAAFGANPRTDYGERERQTDLYFKLIATGLRCLEVVLRQWRLQPKLEALTRFRYATILYQETENFMEAEESLSQGISICDRLRFLDLKYNMQHLLARVMFATNPRAALKFLDGAISDVEAYRHIVWIYAFRFLRVTLSLKMSTPQEVLAAISHLKVISTLATDYRDMTVAATASAMEAIAHLHRANTKESIEQAQRALAVARSSQLDPASQRVPQLVSLMHFIDICCSLENFDPSQAIAKLKAMQQMFDASSQDKNWSIDGLISIPVSHETAKSFQSSGSSAGVLHLDSTNTLNVLLNWLPKEEIYAMGYLMSGAVVLHKNAMDGHKAEQYLNEAKKMIQDMPQHKNGSLTAATSHYLWRRTLLCHIQIHLVFALCARSAWTASKEELVLLKEHTTDLSEAHLEPIQIFIQYLEAVIFQATGDLASALTIYQSPIFALPAPSSPAVPQAHRDLSLLSALNTLLIIRSPTHPLHPRFAPLLSKIEPLALSLSSTSRNINAAYHLIRATASHASETTMFKTKNHLQSALQAAKQCANNQLICITLNFMSWKFFRGVVGEQAEKSAMASANLARKGRDSLWISVADGVLAETLECQGKMEEAEAARREARDVAGRLPLVMQRVLDGEGDGERKHAS